MWVLSLENWKKTKMNNFDNGLQLARWWLRESGQSLSSDEIKKFYSTESIEAWGSIYKYADASDLIKSFKISAQNSDSKGIANIGAAIAQAAGYAAGTYSGISGFFRASKTVASDLTQSGAKAAATIGNSAVSGISGLLKNLSLVVIVFLIIIFYMYMPKGSKAV